MSPKIAHPLPRAPAVRRPGARSLRREGGVGRSGVEPARPLRTAGLQPALLTYAPPLKDENGRESNLSSGCAQARDHPREVCTPACGIEPHSSAKAVLIALTCRVRESNPRRFRFTRATSSLLPNKVRVGDEPPPYSAKSTYRHFRVCPHTAPSASCPPPGWPRSQQVSYACRRLGP